MKTGKSNSYVKIGLYLLGGALERPHSFTADCRH